MHLGTRARIPLQAMPITGQGRSPLSMSPAKFTPAPAWLGPNLPCSYFCSVRIYSTTALIWASVSLPANAGILFFPLLIIASIAAFELFTTEGSLNETILNDLPTGVAPRPSAPWHIRHFAL